MATIWQSAWRVMRSWVPAENGSHLILKSGRWSFFPFIDETWPLLAMRWTIWHIQCGWCLDLWLELHRWIYSGRVPFFLYVLDMIALDLLIIWCWFLWRLAKLVTNGYWWLSVCLLALWVNGSIDWVGVGWLRFPLNLLFVLINDDGAADDVKKPFKNSSTSTPLWIPKTILKNRSGVHRTRHPQESLKESFKTWKRIPNQSTNDPTEILKEYL